MQPADRTDPHGRAVPVAVIRLLIRTEYPACKTGTVVTHRIRVFPAPFHEAVPVAFAVQQGIGNRHRADRVVRKITFLRKQFKTGFVRIVKLEAGADDVSDDCA
ncbi:hypothetical protein Barb4_03583 [Bacteroidales bacterium Barb4]|nr:hypothetical protein Barb4_03583 [Bacteroidales bacterium Barb4]